MKRNSSLKRKITQFSYDHREADSQLLRVRKSLGEVSKVLEKMAPKDNKEEKNEEK